MPTSPARNACCCHLPDSYHTRHPSHSTASIELRVATATRCESNRRLVFSPVQRQRRRPIPRQASPLMRANKPPHASRLEAAVVPTRSPMDPVQSPPRSSTRKRRGGNAKRLAVMHCAEAARVSRPARCAALPSSPCPAQPPQDRRIGPATARRLATIPPSTSDARNNRCLLDYKCRREKPRLSGHCSQSADRSPQLVPRKTRPHEPDSAPPSTSRWNDQWHNNIGNCHSPISQPPWSHRVL